MHMADSYTAVKEALSQAATEPRGTAAVSLDTEKDKFLQTWFQLVAFDKSDNLKPLREFRRMRAALHAFSLPADASPEVHP